MSFPNIINMAEEETLVTYTTERVPVGSLARIEDGRLFRFCENGGTAQVVSELAQGVAPSANFQAEALDTLAAGVTVLTGVGSTTGNGAADLFKYGYVYLLTAADDNPVYRIKSNTLITAAATTGTVTLYTPTREAIAAATQLSYIENPWRDVIVTPNATATAIVTGVPCSEIPIDNFGWLATRGPARVLYVGTVVLNNILIPAATAGSVGPAATQTTTLTDIVGTVITVEATTTNGLAYLKID